MTSSGYTVIQLHLALDNIQDSMVIGRDLLICLKFILNFKKECLQWDGDSMILHTGARLNAATKEAASDPDMPEEYKAVVEDSVHPDLLPPELTSDSAVE